MNTPTDPLLQAPEATKGERKLPDTVLVAAGIAAPLMVGGLLLWLAGRKPTASSAPPDFENWPAPGDAPAPEQ